MNYNDLLLNAYRSAGVKVGYELDDKEEFSVVRNTLVNKKVLADNFDENLKTLIIENSDKCYYANSRNKIYVSRDGYPLIHELFHMASYNKHNGRDIGSMFAGGIGNSLNEGITDTFTSYTVPDYNSLYTFERLYFNILSKMYDKKEILKHHFDGDPDNVYNTFNDDKSHILGITKELDKYTESLVVCDDAFLSEDYGNYNISYDSLINSFSELFNIYSYKKDDKNYLKSLLYFKFLLCDKCEEEYLDKFEMKLRKRR